MNGLLKLLGQSGSDAPADADRPGGSFPESKSSGQLGDPVVVHSEPNPLPDFGSRDSLGAAMLSREDISIWSILKQNIGKELSKITMPVEFNEPLSMLQRVSEYMEYAWLLDAAAKEEDAVRRMELVAAFAVSHLAANADRVAKPFNPLLGETYELERTSTLGFRLHAEQVSHHPPVSAFAAEAPGRWSFAGSVHPKIKFWGPSMEVTPKGLLSLRLEDCGETYTWNNVNCSVHNLVMGRMYIEHTGVVDIACHGRDGSSSPLRAQLSFKPAASWFSAGPTAPANSVQGHIYSGKKKQVRALYGTWTELLASCPPEVLEAHLPAWAKRHKEHRARLDPQHSVAIDHLNGSCPEETTVPILKGSTVLWRAAPRPTTADKFYNFTLFAMCLNEPQDGVPPTDSRQRPDIRAMEAGEWELAASEKSRLEEKQRETRKSRGKQGDAAWSPKWFSERPHPVLAKESVWLPLEKPSYWDRDWSRCDTIF